jgi:hypothetical protein
MLFSVTPPNPEVKRSAKKGKSKHQTTQSANGKSTRAKRRRRTNLLSQQKLVVIIHPRFFLPLLLLLLLLLKPRDGSLLLGQLGVVGGFFFD